MSGAPAALAGLLLLAAPAGAPAQTALVLEGIGTVESWATDSGSALLSRDHGHPATALKAQLFAGAALGPRVQLLAEGELAAGPATDEAGFDYDQIELRYVFSPRCVVDIGKLPTRVGAFANREYAPINPLIGSPDGYAVTYPWTLEVSGATSRVDYRAALASLPFTHEDYVPAPGPAAHVVLGAGYTPRPEVRIGASATWGPYLSDAVSLPAGTTWTGYRQRVLAFDNRISIGYFEWRAELALERYDVPAAGRPLDALDYYVEAKQTWSPRIFTALRVERNDYALIAPPDGVDPWTGRLVNSYNAELGAGYRIAAGALLKVSVRRAWWLVGPELRPDLPDGWAVAAQLSYQADLQRWLERRR